MTRWEHTLDEVEQTVVRLIALGRYSVARGIGIVDGKIGPQTAEETDLEGFAAEYVFCRLMNCYPDFQLGERRDYDARVGEATVDVKTTIYPNGRLLVKASKASHPAEWYALVTGKFPGPYRLRGLAPRDMVMRDAQVQDLGHGPTYAVAQSDLIPPATFLVEVQREWQG